MNQPVYWNVTTVCFVAHVSSTYACNTYITLEIHRYIYYETIDHHALVPGI